MKVVRQQIDNWTLLYYDGADVNGFDCPRRFYNLLASKGRKKKYSRAHEYCAGHGAIGFELLNHNLSDHVVFGDIYAPALVGCEFTAGLNNWSDRITVHQTEKLQDYPAEEKWDLFVCNPPWWPEIKPGPELTDRQKRVLFDVDFALHKNMYANLAQYLTEDADVFICEDNRFSSLDTWKDMIAGSNLSLHAVYSLPFWIVRPDQSLVYLESAYVMHLTKKQS